MDEILRAASLNALADLQTHRRIVTHCQKCRDQRYTPIQGPVTWSSFEPAYATVSKKGKLLHPDLSQLPREVTTEISGPPDAAPLAKCACGGQPVRTMTITPPKVLVIASAASCGTGRTHYAHGFYALPSLVNFAGYKYRPTAGIVTLPEQQHCFVDRCAYVARPCSADTSNFTSSDLPCCSQHHCASGLVLRGNARLPARRPTP